MTFPVVWLVPDVPREHVDSRHRLTWAGAQVEEVLSRLGGEHLVGFDELDGRTTAAVVVPAEYYTGDKVTWLANELNNLDGAVVFLVSDEASKFPAQRLQHRLDRLRLWVQTPRPGRHHGDRFLPFGPPPRTRETLGQRTHPDDVRHLDWFFAGQVNHRHRATLVDVLQGLPRGELIPTQGFTQGVARDVYLGLMAHAKVVPCPAGVAGVDSFRVYEALEAGCLPVVQRRCDQYGPGYWEMVFGEVPPFPMVDDWAELPEVLEAVLPSWPGNAVRALAWWRQWERRLSRRILVDLGEVACAA